MLIIDQDRVIIDFLVDLSNVLHGMRRVQAIDIVVDVLSSSSTSDAAQ